MIWGRGIGLAIRIHVPDFAVPLALFFASDSHGVGIFVCVLMSGLLTTHRTRRK